MLGSSTKAAGSDVIKTQTNSLVLIPAHQNVLNVYQSLYLCSHLYFKLAEIPQPSLFLIVLLLLLLLLLLMLLENIVATNSTSINTTAITPLLPNTTSSSTSDHDYLYC